VCYTCTFKRTSSDSCLCFMSVSHFHDPSASSQNVGNHVGNRPCVRQSQLFRRNESGNAMKELMGQTCLQWDTKRLQGAYTGAAYDPNSLNVQQLVQCEQLQHSPSRSTISPAFPSACAPANFEISQRMQREYAPPPQQITPAQRSLQSTRPW
jgi:hypothetical protein